MTARKAQATLLERFMSRVDTSGDCWEWTAGRQEAGYGYFDVAGHRYRAHRVAYELAVGPIPEGMFVCHRCDNPPCVRPSHLFLGSQLDNVADARAKGRLSPTIFDGTLPRLMLAAKAAHPESWARGERVNTAKLTADQVREIRRRVSAGASQSAVARQFGVGHTNVNHIVRGLSWRHVA